MKDFLNLFIHRRIFLLLVAAVLFVASYFVNRVLAGSTSANYYSKSIERDIMTKEADFERVSTDTVLIRSLIDRTYSEPVLNKVLDKSKGYSFFIYLRDSSSSKILFWNTQTALPPLNLMESDASRMVRLDNGLFVSTSKTMILDGQKYSIEGLIPVMWKYFVEIENLKKEFVNYPDAIQRVDISFRPSRYPVKSSYGNVLFYLQPISFDQQQASVTSLILVIIGLLLTLLYFHQTAHSICRRFGLWPSVIFLSVIILTVRLLTYIYPGFFLFNQFQLFDPGIYSSSVVLSSLGDLLINGLLFLWFVMYISLRMKSEQIRRSKHGVLNWVVIFAVLITLVSLTFLFADILQSLVSDGQISFNVTSFFSLSQYSFIGFVILAILALSYFFSSQIILAVLRSFSSFSWYVHMLICMAIGLTFLSVSKNSSIVELNIYVLIWLMIFFWLHQQRLFREMNSRFNVSEVLFWLFIFSFSIAGVIIFENRKIELEQRERFAERLSEQADPTSEKLLSIALTYLDNDFLAPNFQRFRNKLENSTLKDSIINTNFSPYINKFDTKIYTFDNNEAPLFNEQPVSYDTLNTIFNIQGKGTSILGLNYFEKSFDKMSYIFKKVVVDSSGDKLGYFFVLSEPKQYKNEALVPELFRSTKQLVPEYSPTYSYGIYSKLDLINHYNDYPFPTHLSAQQLPVNEFETRKNDGFEELWYRRSDDKVVLIVKKDNSFLEGITLFAYLFSTFLLLLAIYRAATLLVRSRLRLSNLRQYWQLSIRSQIHSTVILVSLLSFVVIGVATILFFISRYDRNNQDRLSRAIQVMVKELENQIEDHQMFHDPGSIFDPEMNADIERLMRNIAEIHGSDANLYDTSGELRVSSNPFIYNKGVLSTRMNPEAFYNLSNKRVVQYVGEEQMGRVNYFSIYCPVRDKEGVAFAYLNIPFFSTQIELKQEISNFLVTIINLNAFIFLVAGAIALFITNRITSSFTLIGEKMRDINLQKINQEIQWKRKDEIGELVKEYNKMVHKLDESAEVMAKTEREGAWRQMARQVAHEIKNPLTPMKLSIQYLQKAIDNNSPNVKDLTGNVARTLVEQIDHLSKIASDFSQFANIGNPKNEVFDLHDIIYSLVSLYESTNNLQFVWHPVSQRVMLFSDKTQLNRLFTNLVQNALEASENREEKMIIIDERVTEDHIIVSVKDNGAGIPFIMRDKIFTPNFTTKSSGTGLGLAMSKSIAEQAQGDIWFETHDGEGTTFFVKLPLLRVV